MAESRPSLYLGLDCHCCDRPRVRFPLGDRPLPSTVLVCEQCDLSVILPPGWERKSPSG